MRRIIFLLPIWLAAGCVEPPAGRVERTPLAVACAPALLGAGALATGGYGCGDGAINYQSTAASFTIFDAASGDLLVTSSVSGATAGTIVFAGAAPFDGSDDPTDDQLAALADFSDRYGDTVARLLLDLDGHGLVDATQVGALASLAQLVQTLQIYGGDQLEDLQSIAAELGVDYFDDAAPSHRGLLSFGFANTDGTEAAPMAFPFVGEFSIWSRFAESGAPAAEAAPPQPQPNVWLCTGTPYQAGCRGMCGPSCSALFSTTTSSIRCQDGILWRDTVYTGITNECCALHDGDYDACSAKYKCGVGICKSFTFKLRGFQRTINISCKVLVEACRRAADAGCGLCAVAFGYQASDCLLWAVGLGPGTPVSYIDHAKVGTCCPRCQVNMTSTPD